AVGDDAAAIGRLFRRSARLRSKWDERHGELTYGELTIARVLASPRPPLVERRLDLRWAHEITVERLGWVWGPGLGPRPLAGRGGGAAPRAAAAVPARTPPGGRAPGGGGAPAEPVPPATALLAACEDSVERVVVPRLMAAGADRSKVATLGDVIEAAAGDEAR